MSKIKAFGFIIALIGLAAAGLWWNGSLEKTAKTASVRLQTSLYDLSESIPVSMGMSLKDVTIEGRYHTPLPDLRHLFNRLDVQLGRSIFSLDLAQIRTELEAFAWVERAMVSRVLPNHLHVQLTERKAYARFEENNIVYLIDEKGRKITPLSQNIHANDQTFDQTLLLFKGRKSNVYAKRLLLVLRDYPDIRTLLIGATRFSDRRWTLHLNHGGQIDLPAENIRTALDLLMTMQADKRLLELRGHAIDLRMDDRVLIRALSLSSQISPPIPAADTLTNKGEQT